MHAGWHSLQTQTEDSLHGIQGKQCLSSAKSKRGRRRELESLALPPRWKSHTELHSQDTSLVHGICPQSQRQNWPQCPVPGQAPCVHLPSPLRVSAVGCLLPSISALGSPFPLCLDAWGCVSATGSCFISCLILARQGSQLLGSHHHHVLWTAELSAASEWTFGAQPCMGFTGIFPSLFSLHNAEQGFLWGSHVRAASPLGWSLYFWISAWDVLPVSLGLW
jgi:hypothetical protein